MTNKEELFGLSNKDLAKRLVGVRVRNHEVNYLCPDGTMFHDGEKAVKYVEMWLEAEITEGRG